MRDPMSPAFHTNLIYGLRFFQVGVICSFREHKGWHPSPRLELGQTPETPPGSSGAFSYRGCRWRSTPATFFEPSGFRTSELLCKEMHVTGPWSRPSGTKSPLIRPSPPHCAHPSTGMLYYSILFLIVAIVAAILGFGGLAGTAAWVAKTLFIDFLILFIVSLITGRRTGA